MKISTRCCSLYITSISFEIKHPRPKLPTMHRKMPIPVYLACHTSGYKRTAPQLFVLHHRCQPGIEAAHRVRAM
jgi:hypothetical protein